MTLYLEHVKAPALKMDDLADETVCTKEFFAAYAKFLMDVYVIAPGHKNAGERLGWQNVINIVNDSLQRAKGLFELAGNDVSRKFLADVYQVGSPVHAWIRDLKEKIRQLLFDRMMEAGETIDKSETPIYTADLMGCNAAWSKTGHTEATNRKFIVTTLQRACGRSGEVSWLTWKGLRWDTHFMCMFVEVPQPKTGKLKIVAFAAGSHRHNDWFTDLGDYLTVGQMSVWEEGEPAWVFPQLRGTNGASGTVIGGYLKALLPLDRGGKSNGRYLDNLVDSLPDNATAGGIRPGIINELAANMPAELVVQASGHNFASMSALWDYLDASLALCMAAAVVLGGWPALSWGRNGIGPVPATLVALEDDGFGPPDNDRLENMIDTVFRIDSASPPGLMRDQRLRPMVHAAFASLVMYYVEREDADEMGLVRIKYPCEAF
jgi:hypothetical protein